VRAPWITRNDDDGEFLPFRVVRVRTMDYSQ
jgi:hypothetical protein